MTEKTEVINTRFSEREKQIVEQYAAACGRSQMPSAGSMESLC